MKGQGLAKTTAVNPSAAEYGHGACPHHLTHLWIQLSAIQGF